MGRLSAGFGRTRAAAASASPTAAGGGDEGPTLCPASRGLALRRSLSPRFRARSLELAHSPDRGRSVRSLGATPGPQSAHCGRDTGSAARAPVPLCLCAPGTTALPRPPSPPRGAVEPAPPAAPAVERTSGQRSRVPVARAPCPGSARPGCGPPPRPSPASAAVPAPPPGRQTCPGRHLPGGRRHLGFCSGRSSVLLNRVSCPGAVQGGFGWPFVGKLLITQNLVSNRPDLFKSAESNLPFFNIYSGVCWKFATEFRLKLKVTRIYYCFLRMLSLMGCPLFI